jgi:DNA repair ATPase RecN
MAKGQDFGKLYTNVARDLSAALEDIDRLDVQHDKGQAHLATIKASLGEMKARFDDEIDYLDQHAEWDKFTIAFFGETNAGKSTIIESLRVLFNEQKRQALITRNQASAKELQAEFSQHSEELIEALGTHYQVFGLDVSTLSQEVGALAQLTQNDLKRMQSQLDEVSLDLEQTQRRLGRSRTDADDAREQLHTVQRRLEASLASEAQLQSERQQWAAQLGEIQTVSTQQLVQIRATEAQLAQVAAEHAQAVTALTRLGAMKLALGGLVGLLLGSVGGAFILRYLV